MAGPPSRFSFLSPAERTYIICLDQRIGRTVPLLSGRSFSFHLFSCRSRCQASPGRVRLIHPARLPSPQSLVSSSPISPLTQTERDAISLGAYASPSLTQAYTAFGLSAVMRQKGYLMMPGVFIPTPSSR